MDEWKIIMGTSNVQRYYDPKNFTYQPYIVKKCCKIETFRATAAMMTSQNEYVVISVFENILVDAVNASLGINQVEVPGSESGEFTVDTIKTAASMHFLPLGGSGNF